MKSSFDPVEAVIYLSERDPIMGALIHAVGPYTVETEGSVDVFEALCQAIVHQQLSGKAAGTIYSRFTSLLPPGSGIHASDVLPLDPDALRACGLSRAKTLAILDLAEKSVSGIVPHMRELFTMSDEDILETLTQVRGVGTWTVQMLLMFRLGRPDVFPATDLGVQKGYALVYRRENLPKPRDLEVIAEQWKPFRTVAAWYFWRALELDPDSDALPS
jgi:3-methyladenine DNA glycosylase/8-oxoguanine DNA glycosylase